MAGSSRAIAEEILATAQTSVSTPDPGLTLYVKFNVREVVRGRL